jgi:cell division ATPase FtsA
VHERLALLNQNGVDPMNLDLDMAAVYNAAQASGAFEAHPDCVLLDIGATTTNILFVKEGELKSCRSLRAGSESITRALSQDLAVDTDSARDRAEQGDGSPREDDLLAPIPLEIDEDGGDPTRETERSAGELENAIVLQKQNDFISRIHRETARSLSIYSTDVAVSAIYLTGAASLARGVKERLEQQFRKPVIRLDFLNEGDHAVDAADHERVNAGLGIALGCALKMLGQEGLDLEFRRDELRYTRKFDLIKVALASTVSLIFILMFLTWLNYQNTLKIRRHELGEILRHLNGKYLTQTKQMYKGVLEDQAKPLRNDPDDKFRLIPAWQDQVRTMDRHITSELGFNVQGIPPIRSALEVWKDLFEKLDGVRTDLGYMYLDDLKVTQKSSSFKGLLGNRGNVDVIEIEVKKLPYVEDVRRDRTEEKEGRFKFGITTEFRPTKAKGKPKGKP